MIQKFFAASSALISGLIVKLFFWFVNKKPQVTDAEGPGKEEKKFDDEIKKEGW